MKKTPLFASTLIAASFALSVPALAASVTWTGSVNSTWDTNTANWSGDSTTFTNNDNVTFSGSGTGTITISGAIEAGTMTVSSGNYTFSADGTTNTLKVNKVSVTGSDTITFTGGGEFSISDYEVEDSGSTYGASLAVGENTTVTIGDYHARWHQGTTTLSDGAVLNITTQLWFSTNDTEVLTGGTFNIQQLTLSNAATIVSVHDAVLNIGSGDGYNGGLKNDGSGYFGFGDNLTVGVYAGTSGTNTGWSTSAEIRFTGTDNTGTTFSTNAGETIELGGKISGVGFTNTGSGTLILSGTVALSDAIINSGNITISSGTTLVLDNLEATYVDGTGYYEIIAGSGNSSSVDYSAGNITFTYNDSELSGWNIATDSSGNVWVYGEVGLLTWNGTSTSNNWNTTDTTWSVDGTSYTFSNNDNVVFDSTAANKTVNITESVKPGSITVSDDYTFTTNQTEGVTVDASGSLTVAEGKTLTIDSGVTVYIDGTTFENFTVNGGGTIGGTGTIEIDLTGNTYASTIDLGDGNTFAGTVYVHSGEFHLAGSNIGNGTYELGNGVNIEVASSGVSVSNNIVFDGTSQFHVNSGYTATLNGVVSGEGTLDKRGAGTLVLAGGADLNTVLLSVGTVRFDGEGKTFNITTITKGENNNAVTLEVSSGTTVNAGTLNADWYLGTIKVDGTLNISGTAEFGVGAGSTETITGTGTVTVGTLEVGHHSNSSNGSTVKIDGGLTFIANSITTGVITNDSHLQLGNTTFGTSNANGLTFADTITEVTLIASGDDGKTTFNTNVYDVSSNSFTTTGTTITIGVSVVGGGDIAVTGSGTLALSGTSTLGSVTVNSGATLDLSSGTVSVSSTIQNSGTVVVNDSTVFVLDNLTGTEDGSGTTYVIISGGTIDGNWTSLTKDNFSLSGSTITSVDVSQSGQVTVSFDVVNLIWNGGSGNWNTTDTNWTKDGSTVAFTNGDNVTFDGTSTGTVTVQNAGVTANSVTVSDGTYSFKGGNINVNTTFTIGTGAEVDLDGAVVYADFVVNGTLKLDVTNGGGSDGEVHGTITINNGGRVELDNGDVTGYGDGDGVTQITINAGGTLYVGTTANQTLGSCDLILVGGTIDGVDGSNLDLFHSSTLIAKAAEGASADNPTVSTVTNVMLTSRNDDGTTEVRVEENAKLLVESGFWSGPNSQSSYNGNIEKTGAGTLEVSGIFALNTGNLIISEGTVILSGTVGYTGSGAGTTEYTLGFASSVSVASGANLEICFKEDASISNVSGAGDFTKSGDTKLTIDGYTVSGKTTVSEGTLVLTGSTEVIDVHVTSGATLDLTSASKAGGDGNGSLYIDGGTVKVSSMAWGSGSNFGANMNNCYLQISNGGVLEVTATQAAETAGRRGFAVMEGTGTYKYSGTGTSYIAANETNQDIHIADGTTLIFEVVKSDATLDVSKKIANTYNGATAAESTGSLVKTGEGTLKLSGENLYSGGTTIKEGVLVAANSSALGTGAVYIDGGQLSISENVTITNSVSVTLSNTYLVSDSVSPTSLGSGTLEPYAAGAEGDGIYAITGTGSLGSSSSQVTITLFIDDTIAELLAEAGETGLGFYLLDESSISADSSFTVSLSDALSSYTATYDTNTGIVWIVGAAAPEPSMFGVFAGLGTLLLVSTRRRRRKVA